VVKIASLDDWSPRAGNRLWRASYRGNRRRFQVTRRRSAIAVKILGKKKADRLGGGPPIR